MQPSPLLPLTFDGGVPPFPPGSDLETATHGRGNRTREKAILQAALDAIVIIGAEQYVVEWNPAAESIFGWSRDEAVGQTLADLIIPERFREAHRAGMVRYLTTGQGSILKQRLELPALRKDGEEILVELIVTDIRTEDEVLFAGFMRDITETRRAQVALEAARHEAEVARREAEAAREEADRVSRSKSDFLSRMSHELRTPLNAILGFGQLLQVAPMPAGSREHVDHIIKGGHHLLNLINEILDTARIEAGQLSLSMEPICVEDVCRDVLAMIAPLAEHEGITVDPLVSTDPTAERTWVMADAQRLRQILINLLSNAVKYNRPNGRVRLEAEIMDGGQVRFRVHDTGRGISPENIDRLFLPFERLGAETTNIEGTGIGLALSKRLASVMDGALEAFSQEGVGSIFALTLPITDPPVYAAAALALETPPEMTGAGHSRVLYIEDHPSNVELMQGIFSLRPDLALEIATTGSEGLEMARLRTPDLVMLDLHLPGLSGEDVLDQMKVDPQLREVPVIIVSADATPAQVEALVLRGASAFITKPVDIGALFEALHENLPAI